MSVKRIDLIKKHKEAFEAFGKAGIDPTRHNGYLALYEQSRGKPHKEVASKFKCSRTTVYRANTFLTTEI